ncbi:MAG: glycerol-3-phosphate 1-O-acyltransferase PlsY [Thiomargarita sp.]|nr:glycerol-3-phosphate 1-O-acyltransferase PlsY [Thiomargarita sp.]
MDNLILSGSVIVFAYLLGSLSGAIIICKIQGLPDPRSQGSGNPGATNMLRQGGKKLALITLIFDILKGIVAVLVAKLVIIEPVALALVAIAVFLGHLYPVFFQFRGGKGVATAFGALVALVWMVGLAVLATWLAVAFLFRYSSLAAVMTAIFAPIYLLLLTNIIEYVIMGAIISMFLVWKHRSNIRNLYSGAEDKF